MSIQPPRAVLRGEAGRPIQVEVVVTPSQKYPFTITGSRAVHGENFRYRLKPVAGADPVSYLLTVENAKDVSGRYFGSIMLKTDSELKPEISIPVSGDIRGRTP